ncbi:MAG: hypothetical protein B7Y95_07475 [Rhizobiales bacterium 32-66-11]|nr:MAG: hypothetical protein B7Y95_07475 [Rhizobiales bacterium 32-66-11]
MEGISDLPLHLFPSPRAGEGREGGVSPFILTREMLASELLAAPYPPPQPSPARGEGDQQC